VRSRHARTDPSAGGADKGRQVGGAGVRFSAHGRIWSLIHANWPTFVALCGETHTRRGREQIALDVFLQPGNVGALTFPAAGRFYHDWDRGRTHHLS
jgi:hypothetical protein